MRKDVHMWKGRAEAVFTTVKRGDAKLSNSFEFAKMHIEFVANSRGNTPGKKPSWEASLEKPSSQPSTVLYMAFIR